MSTRITGDDLITLLLKAAHEGKFRSAIETVEQWVASADAELTRLREIVEKLPVTADGVSVVPGVDRTWHREHVGGGDYEWVASLASTASHLVTKSYSSLEAAESQNPTVHRHDAEEG